MGRLQKHPLRSLTAQEKAELGQLTKASSARLDQVQRARALLAVAAGQTFGQAASAAGFQSGEAVSPLVERFNQRGRAVLETARGRGRQPTYNSAARGQVLATLRRTPDRRQDGAATWSLRLLERAVRTADAPLPQIGATTLRRILHEAGYSYQRTRTWCLPGQAQRVRKDGVVTVLDPEREEKNARSSGPTG